MIEISVDPWPLIKNVDGMEKQLPYAVSRALNECAVAFQVDERAVIQREFTIRRPWVLKGVKIDRSAFATKQQLHVTIHIDPERDFLNKFEQGGVRRPRQGGKSLVVPAEVRTSPTNVIPANMRPRAFGFREVGGKNLIPYARKLTSKGLKSGILGGQLRVFAGVRGALLIQAENGTGVLMQRMGRGKSSRLRMLYRLRASTKVPADLHFVETARKSFAKHWPLAFTKWWNESVRTAHTGAPIQQGMVLPAGFSE